MGRQVSNLAIHPEFDGRNLQNDFAVLFVSEDFILDQHLDTACLPDANEIFDSTTCFATGWGKDQFGAAGQYQVVLKEIGLPVGTRPCVRTSSGPPGWARSTSSMTPSSAPGAWQARTHARVTEAPPWSALASMTPTPMSRLGSWPGASGAVRMVCPECTLM